MEVVYQTINYNVLFRHFELSVNIGIKSFAAQGLKRGEPLKVLMGMVVIMVNGMLDLLF
jgi:hypothetical protein